MAGPYREVIIKGDDKILKGFLAAYRSLRRVSSGLFMCRRLPIDTGHLREVLAGKFSWEHVIVSTSHHKALIAAIKRAADELNIEIVSDRRVRKASFDFHFETFSRKVGSELKRLYKRPPAGIRFKSVDVHEDEDPQSRGVELYSAAHDYVMKGKGKAVGDIEALLKLHKKFHDHEFIDVNDIVISH